MSRNSMKSGDLLRGSVYDVIGSEVVEAAAAMMQEELRKEVAVCGMKITNRFSPGYCGWDVAEQHKLFSFFNDNFCGIILTESALMNPVKSVSGLIGIGEHVRYVPYQCHLCDDRNCIYRSRKSTIPTGLF
jgi:cobalamin-dependent methionine synthase I